MTGIEIKIPRTKAELPAIIVTLVLCFVGWAFHFGFFSWTGGFIWLAVVLPILGFIYWKRHGTYFVKTDINGISWRQNIFSKYIYIPWNYLHRVDYLLYEINFMIRETGQVVSFPTSGLKEDDTERLKESISEALGEKARPA